MAKADGKYNRSIVIVRGPLKRSIATAGWGCCRQQPSQPSPTLPCPPLPSPTPSTNTCSRRAATAKARSKYLRTVAKFFQVVGSRTRLVWLVGGRVLRAQDTPLQAQHSLGSAAHRRPHPGLYRTKKYANCCEEPTVEASASSPYSLQNRIWHEPAPCCD